MGGLRLVRNSEIKTYKRCRLRWDWSYNLHLEPSQSASALRFGELVHGALERWYIPGRKRGPHPAKTFIKLYQKQLERLTRLRMKKGDDWIDADELGVAMLKHYVEHYGTDDHIEIVAPEMPFKVRLAPDVVSVGKLDAVYRDLSTGRLGIIDHKTAASIGTGHLTLDEQAGTYFAVAPSFLRWKGILEPNEDLSVITYNFLRKAVPDQRPFKWSMHKGVRKKLYCNKDGSVSKSQPPDYFHREPVWRGEADRKEIIGRIISTSREMQRARDGELEIIKNPTDRCQFDCQFKDPCELHEQGSDWEEMLDMAYVEWDPYSDHEVARKG